MTVGRQTLSTSSKTGQEPEFSFAWVILAHDDVNKLLECNDLKLLEELLATKMNITNYKTELRPACLLDYYMAAFYWAKMNKFKPRHLSGFFTLVDNLMTNLRENQFTKLECFEYIKKSLGGIGEKFQTRKCSDPLFFLTEDEAKLIFSYLSDTFLKHFTLYEYVFGTEQDEFIVGKEIDVQVCSNSLKFPPPLVEGVNLAHYEKYINREEILTNDHNLSNEEEEASVDDQEEISEKSEEEKFVDNVVDQVMGSESSMVAEIDADELRNIVRKFTEGILLPHRQALEDKIKMKEEALINLINSDKPVKTPSPKKTRR